MVIPNKCDRDMICDGNIRDSSKRNSKIYPTQPGNTQVPVLMF